MFLAGLKSSGIVFVDVCMLYALCGTVTGGGIAPTVLVDADVAVDVKG